LQHTLKNKRTETTASSRERRVQRWLIVACKRERVREMERERAHKKRGGESNGVDCDEESGDQTGVRKVVPSEKGRGGGGRTEERRDGSQGGPYNNQKKLLLAELLLSSCFFL
jgi:hypothetical protein